LVEKRNLAGVVEHRREGEQTRVEELLTGGGPQGELAVLDPPVL
jgi:hypothetical protein